MYTQDVVFVGPYCVHIYRRWCLNIQCSVLSVHVLARLYKDSMEIMLQLCTHFALSKRVFLTRE